jgi:hypothetical protein
MHEIQTRLHRKYGYGLKTLATQHQLLKNGHILKADDPMTDGEDIQEINGVTINLEAPESLALGLVAGL